MIPLAQPQVYDYNDEDRPQHLKAGALTDLFNDGFFSSTFNKDSGEVRVPGPDDFDYDPWNAPTPPFAESAPSPTINGETAAPSAAVPVTSADVIDVQPLTPPSAQSPAPSPVVPKRRTRNNASSLCHVF